MLCYKQYLTHCATSQNHGEIANGLFRLWFQSRCMQDLFAPSQTMVGPSVAPNMPDAISIGRAGPKCGCKVGAPLGGGGVWVWVFYGRSNTKIIGDWVDLSSRSWGPLYKSTCEKKAANGRIIAGGILEEKNLFDCRI